jgi:two-component system sensor histidine kinase BaeS
MTALLILVSITTAVFLLGYKQSLDAWSRNKQSKVGEAVEKVLTGSTGAEDLMLPDDIPLFIYDASGNLIYSNRGQGRHKQTEDEDLISVVKDNEIIGYYYSGLLHFRNDSANESFIQSMTGIVWLSLLSALTLSLLFALLFSKSLSSPSRKVAEGLDQITRGNLNLSIPEKGTTEIALIARSANRLSRQLSKEKELRHQWAADITHDLRTPISALKAQFEGMRDGVLDIDPARIDKNLNEITRMEKLVFDLEELMRLEAPEMSLNLRNIHARDLLNEIRERFSYELVKKEIKFSCQSNVEAFTGDESLIQRALSNFVSNAVRHADTAGEIRITVKKQEKNIVISVFNTGETIPGEELNRIFDRLFRGEKARTSPGSGLGLTIAKKIADLHGGEIRISSRESEGTTVELLLPAE